MQVLAHMRQRAALVYVPFHLRPMMNVQYTILTLFYDIMMTRGPLSGPYFVLSWFGQCAPVYFSIRGQRHLVQQHDGRWYHVFR